MVFARTNPLEIPVPARFEEDSALPPPDQQPSSFALLQHIPTPSSSQMHITSIGGQLTGESTARTSTLAKTTNGLATTSDASALDTSAFSNASAPPYQEPTMQSPYSQQDAGRDPNNPVYDNYYQYYSNYYNQGQQHPETITPSAQGYLASGERQGASGDIPPTSHPLSASPLPPLPTSSTLSPSNPVITSPVDSSDHLQQAISSAALELHHYLEQREHERNMNENVQASPQMVQTEYQNVDENGRVVSGLDDSKLNSSTA